MFRLSSGAVLFSATFRSVAGPFSLISNGSFCRGLAKKLVHAADHPLPRAEIKVWKYCYPSQYVLCSGAKLSTGSTLPVFLHKLNTEDVSRKQFF
jgi:hypothetical protein